jgi:hypothetical protein
MILTKKKFGGIMKKFLFFLVICVFALSIGTLALEGVSPAIDIIAGENVMIKSDTVASKEICFDTNDFDKPTGTNVSSIKVTQIPSSEQGKLMLGNLYIVNGQVIEREDFSSIRFIPRTKDTECTFKFSPNGASYELECILKTIKEVNFSPVSTNGALISVWTGTDISRFGVLDGHDPDGDEIKFEIVSLPEKGLIEITNAKTGDYKYTPFAGARGKDTFTYRVMDEYGNYSAEATVNVKIEKLKTTLVFSDMSGNKALNAACVVADKYMSVQKNQDGTYSFEPSRTVTTEEFLALVMDVMGAKNVPVLSKTRFADDESIDAKYKGYFESAFALGIIEGERKSDGIYVNPKAEITTANASVIINKIIGASGEGARTTFSDGEDMPDWARASITSLCEIGILSCENGKINPNSPLTRAQTAQILMSLLEYRGKLKH